MGRPIPEQDVSRLRTPGRSGAAPRLPLCAATGWTAEKWVLLFHVCPRPGFWEARGSREPRGPRPAPPGPPPHCTLRALRRPDLMAGAPRRGGKAPWKSCRSWWLWCLLTWGSGHKVALGREGAFCAATLRFLGSSRRISTPSSTGAPREPPTSTFGGPCRHTRDPGHPLCLPSVQTTNSKGVRAPQSCAANCSRPSAPAFLILLPASPEGGLCPFGTVCAAES